MKNKDKLRELSERIRELVPRLMDLSLGCEVKCPLTGILRVFLEATIPGGARLQYITGSVYYCVFTPSEFSKFKIIGHPITKADIEDALFQSGIYHEEDISQNILPKLCFVWDYDIKTLSEQKPEVIDALHSLFLKTK